MNEQDFLKLIDDEKNKKIIYLHRIILELQKVIKILGGQSDILSIVNSYDDTLEDKEILEELKSWIGGKSG